MFSLHFQVKLKFFTHSLLLFFGVLSFYTFLPLIYSLGFILFFIIFIFTYSSFFFSLLYFAPFLVCPFFLQSSSFSSGFLVNVESSRILISFRVYTSATSRKFQFNCENFYSISVVECCSNVRSIFFLIPIKQYCPHFGWKNFLYK